MFVGRCSDLFTICVSSGALLQQPPVPPVRGRCPCCCAQEAAPRHVVSLVRDVAVETARSLLGAVSSQHVYSLQPCIPKDPSELHSSDLIQAQELFAQAPLMEDNCLRDNRYSAVKCSLVRVAAWEQKIRTCGGEWILTRPLHRMAKS